MVEAPPECHALLADHDRFFVPPHVRQEVGEPVHGAAPLELVADDRIGLCQVPPDVDPLFCGRERLVPALQLCQRSTQAPERERQGQSMGLRGGVGELVQHVTAAAPSLAASS
ncbi:hypothetical protein AB0953_34800 [Streptomyces sp. NPDC046866]|uniref:hypothetical protein n=1 Tax=Streptomyces sp. NPDC046866 TaxID=3154921 RepID=UPI0034529B57